MSKGKCPTDYCRDYPHTPDTCKYYFGEDNEEGGR